MKKILRKFFKYIFKLFKWILIIFISSSLLSVILFKYLPIPFTSLMIIRTWEQYKSDEKVVWNKTWVPLTEISPNLIEAVVASEDQRYLNHNGFDFEEIRKAQKENKTGKRIRGASTISQQTAKNAFLWPKRSYIRKSFEAWFTLWIELIWGKKRIMEVYLNVIEFGNGIYGCEAASQYFFKKPASKLTKKEAALLAAVLPHPLKSNPKNPSSYLNKRSNDIINQMNKLPKIDF